MDENKKDIGPTNEELEEAHDLNKIVKEFHSSRKQLDLADDVVSNPFNNNIVERQVLLSEKIARLEKDPEIKECFDTAVESVKEAFPEYVKDTDLKSFLSFVSRETFEEATLVSRDETGKIAVTMPATRLVMFIEDYLEERKNHHPVHALAHEFTHVLSYRKGKFKASKRGYESYYTTGGICDREIEFEMADGEHEEVKGIAGANVKDEQLNELITDYFAVSALLKWSEKRPEKADKVSHILEQSGARYNYMLAHMIEDIVGEKVLKRAYFEGSKNELVEALGRENFNKLSKLLDKMEIIKAIEVLEDMNGLK